MHPSLKTWIAAAAAACLCLLTAAAFSGEIAQEAPGRFDMFDEAARSAFERSGVPGMAVVIVTGDDVSYLQCFGVRREGFPEPVTENSVFQLASCSKAFASAAAAALAGEGRINWDDLLIDRLNGFRLNNPYVTSHITIRDGLCHRSGLPEHLGDDLENMFHYDRNEVLFRHRFQKLVTEFRTTFAYQNYMYTAATLAAVAAANTDWYTLAAERIFKPLGMTSTSALFADFEKREDQASGHLLRFGRMVTQPPRNADARSPAGGVSSSIADMSRWLRFLVNNGRFGDNQVVPVKAFQETVSPQIITGTEESGIRTYGLGWEIHYYNGREIVRHDGSSENGFSALVEFIPSRKTGLAVLTNAAPCGLTEALGKAFEDLVYEGGITADWWALSSASTAASLDNPVRVIPTLPRPPAIPSPSFPLPAYAGTYANDFYGNIRIEAADTGLQLFLGRNRTPYPLFHWDRDTFSLNIDDKDTGVYFTMGGHGQAETVLLKRLDYGGRNGLFKRTDP